MKQRCLNSDYKQYRDYGGRGITICERWLESFFHFLEDMGECPPFHELDRINNDGNYESGNCRWATRAMSARNKRSNRWFTIRGVHGCMKDLATLFGNELSTVNQRLKRGWSEERAFCTVAKHR